MLHTHFDVVILGAGVAGLTAAVHLANAGLKPLVLEAAKTPGGRARSQFDPTLNEEVDNGPHLLLGTYQHTLELLSLLGTRHLLLEEKNVVFSFWNRMLGWHQLACPDWPAPWHLLAGISRFPAFSVKDWLATLRIGIHLLEDHEPLEKLSVTQWLQSHQQTEALFQRLWQPLCLATLNEPPASANAALFATVLKRLFLSNRQAARPLLPTTPLSQLLALPAQRFIHAAGGEVRCGCRVKGLEMTDAGIQSIHTQHGTLHKPKAVIAALPYYILTRLLPEWTTKTAISQLQSAPIVSVHLNYPQPINLPNFMIGLPHETSQWIIDRGKIQHYATTQTADKGANDSGPTSSGGKFSAVLSAAYRERTWSQEQLISTVHQDLLRIMPQLAHLTPSAARVFKEHRATFATWPETSQYRPTTQTPWHNFYLAGDWTRTGLPATLEGAALSGVQAAQKTRDLLAPWR